MYFDPEVPQNRNVRFKSKKQNLLEVMGPEQRWIECDKNTTIDDMIAKGHRILFQHFINNMEDEQICVEERQVFIQKWMADICSRKCRDYFDLRRDVFWMIKDNTVYFFE